MKGPKQLQIHTKELDWLRNQLATRFEEKTGRIFEAKTTPARYAEMIDVISENHLPESQDEYLSQNLLRKLFYDTRSANSTVFRTGFIDACYRIISLGEHNRFSYLKENGLPAAPNYLRDLSLKEGFYAATTGGLIGGFSAVILMRYFSADFTMLKNPIDASDGGAFGSLILGMLGGISMWFLSLRIASSDAMSRKFFFSGIMLILGSSLLLGSHVVGAETIAEREVNSEWAALALHGAVSSVVIINLINFHEIYSILQGLFLSCLSSLAGGVFYYLIIWAAKNSIFPEPYTFGRGLFVIVATFAYLMCVLMPFYFLRKSRLKFA